MSKFEVKCTEDDVIMCHHNPDREWDENKK
jgi:hypothetical protein